MIEVTTVYPNMITGQGSPYSTSVISTYGSCPDGTTPESGSSGYHPRLQIYSVILNNGFSDYSSYFSVSTNSPIAINIDGNAPLGNYTLTYYVGLKTETDYELDHNPLQTMDWRVVCVANR